MFYRCPKLAAAILLAIALAPAAMAKGKLRDPYQNIEIFELKNKTKVVLAPSKSADTIEIRLSVKAGQFQDLPGKSGTAHLLEHYLFNGENLPKDTSYLDLIREKGGTANGMTKAEETVYYATMPKENGVWIVEVFQKLIDRQKFTRKEVEIAKKPVFLEIGRATPMDYVSDSVFKLTPFSLPSTNFWQVEFGFENNRSQTSANADKIDTFSISEQDVKDFYAKHYRPENVTLTLAGGLPANARALIEKGFGRRHNQPGPPLFESAGNPKIRPLVRSSVTNNTPRIVLGAKVADVTAQQKIIGEIYLNHLAHRMMKELRNRKGQSYTVSDSARFRKRHGLLTIRFDTSEEQYYENLASARELIRRESQDGEISLEEFREAKKFYETEFKLNEDDADTRLYYAQGLVRYLETFAPAAYPTPFAAYQSVDYETYKSELAYLFRPEMRYEVRTEPPVFFRYDNLFTYALGFFLFLALARKFYLYQFPHAQVRWVRKLRYFPLYGVQIATLGIIVAATLFTSKMLDLLWLSTALSSGPPLVSEYARSFLLTGCAVGIYQFYMSLMIRKVIVTSDLLWLKSLGYHSHVYGLSHLKSVHVMHPLKILLSPTRLYRVGFRFYYYFDLHFWQKGVLLTFENGTQIFLALANASQAAEELRAMIPAPAITIVKEDKAA